ncbi:MAG: hypothetical protein ACUVQ7_09655 [bacterium]
MATNNLSTLGKDLIESVSQKVSVILTPQLQEYIKAALTDPIYKNIRTIAAKPFEENSDKPTIQIELQDLYLANSELPSRRGKLINDDWNKYLYLALNLGLLRKGTYSLVVRGQSFLSLVSDDERKAFGRRGGNEGSNPLQLTMPQRLLLLFSFIDGDGDVLKNLYRKLLPISQPFTDSEAGDYLPEIYRAIVKQSRPRARSGDDISKIQKLIDVADKIEAWKGKQSKGKDARLHTVTPRLEPFVDLGLLSKPDPFAYRYQVTDVTRTFFEPLINAESIEHFLHHSFFDATNKAFNLNGEHRTDREIILPVIQKAYTVLKSPLGYAPILEVSLLAGIYSITESGAYFEPSESLDVLKSLQKERPELVRFNVDRWGALTFVKFNDDIRKVMGG